MKKSLFFLLIMIFTVQIFSQKFLIPIENSYITSSFGEYRDTGKKPHFHTGIDFSSFARVGYPVKSANDGYVNKIWLNNKIYGNTIFIYHPDYDLITVYAHLNSFDGIVDEIANSVTSEIGNSFAEIKFPENEIMVSRGEVIGFSGKSGEATVPNVHFEIRKNLKSGNKNNEIIKDAIEFVDYTELREKKLMALKIRSGKNTIELKENELVEIPFYTVPKLEVNILQFLGKNTRIIPKSISLKINDELIYKIEFDQIRQDEMYSPGSVFGYGSTIFNYWIKLYSSSNITPIKVNRWNEILFALGNKALAELILKDMWGNIKTYKFILKKES